MNVCTTCCFVGLCNYESKTHEIFSTTNVKNMYSIAILNVMNPQCCGDLSHTLALSRTLMVVSHIPSIHDGSLEYILLSTIPFVL